MFERTLRAASGETTVGEAGRAQVSIWRDWKQTSSRTWRSWRTPPSPTASWPSSRATETSSSPSGR